MTFKLFSENAQIDEHTAMASGNPGLSASFGKVGLYIGEI
jgi:hypothetical protein